MQRIRSTAVLAIILLGAIPLPALAGGIQVEPVLLDLTAPTAAGVLTLRNNENFDVAVQTRVLRWSQNDGKESLEPATEVVASPPIVTLAPGADYTVRVVRTSKQSVRAEESYRLWVDQLPNAHRQSQSGINILLRQSIPVFFRAAQLTRGNIAWALRLQAGRLLVDGRNNGDERLRVASLRLRDSAGRTAAFGDGLVGYVLGRSSMTFTITNPPRGFGDHGPISIGAETNAGAIHATALLQTGP